MKPRDLSLRMQRVSQANGASPAAALACLARGWSVAPLRPRERRRLLLWELFQAELPLAWHVAGWFRRVPHASIDIIIAAVSRLIVLDIDPKNGGDHSLESLERRFRALCRPSSRAPLDDAEMAEMAGSIFRLDQQQERAERHSRWPTC
jgi:hypothetical protein